MVLVELNIGMNCDCFSVRSEENLCNFRPSESISPKREFQSLVLGFGSHFSPRRLVSGLSDQYSRLGDRGSHKRGHDEACAC